MKLKLKLTLLLILLVNTFFYAQDSYTLKGIVASKVDNSPLPGVTIRIAKTNTGSQTDFDGVYSIKVKVGDILEFSYLGYKAQTIIITNQKTLNVTMIEDNSVLDEIIIVGYGSQKSLI